VGGLTLYPARQRCRKCRRYFGPLVVDGQWCSYHCAGKDVPSDDPNEWPRQHYRQGFGPRVAKVAYLCEADALASPGGRAAVYRCTYCWMWHRASVWPSSTHQEG